MNSELQIPNAQVRADAANNRKIKEMDIQFKKNMNQITTQLKKFPTYKLTQKKQLQKKLKEITRKRYAKLRADAANRRRRNGQTSKNKGKMSQKSKNKRKTSQKSKIVTIQTMSKNYNRKSPPYSKVKVTDPKTGTSQFLLTETRLQPPSSRPADRLPTVIRLRPPERTFRIIINRNARTYILYEQINDNKYILFSNEANNSHFKELFNKWKITGFTNKFETRLKKTDWKKPRRDSPSRRGTGRKTPTQSHVKQVLKKLKETNKLFLSNSDDSNRPSTLSESNRDSPLSESNRPSTLSESNRPSTLSNSPVMSGWEKPRPDTPNRTATRVRTGKRSIKKVLEEIKNKEKLFLKSIKVETTDTLNLSGEDALKKLEKLLQNANKLTASELETIKKLINTIGKKGSEIIIKYLKLIKTHISKLGENGANLLIFIIKSIASINIDIETKTQYIGDILKIISNILNKNKENAGLVIKELWEIVKQMASKGVNVLEIWARNYLPIIKDLLIKTTVETSEILINMSIDVASYLIKNSIKYGREFLKVLVPLIIKASSNSKELFYRTIINLISTLNNLGNVGIDIAKELLPLIINAIKTSGKLMVISGKLMVILVQALGHLALNGIGLAAELFKIYVPIISREIAKQSMVVGGTISRAASETIKVGVNTMLELLAVLNGLAQDGLQLSSEMLKEYLPIVLNTIKELIILSGTKFVNLTKYLVDAIIKITLIVKEGSLELLENYIPLMIDAILEVLTKIGNGSEAIGNILATLLQNVMNILITIPVEYITPIIKQMGPRILEVIYNILKKGTVISLNVLLNVYNTTFTLLYEMGLISTTVMKDTVGQLFRLLYNMAGITISFGEFGIMVLFNGANTSLQFTWDTAGLLFGLIMDNVTNRLYTNGPLLIPDEGRPLQPDPGQGPGQEQEPPQPPPPPPPPPPVPEPEPEPKKRSKSKQKQKLPQKVRRSPVSQRTEGPGKPGRTGKQRDPNKTPGPTMRNQSTLTYKGFF